MINTVDTIINKFGGQNSLSKKLGCRQSTVFGWKKRGFIPAHRQAQLLDLAQKEGIDLQPGNLIFPLGGASMP